MAAVYLLWIPLREPSLVLVARATESVLSWVWSPPLVTSLEAAGEDVDIRGILLQPGQWMGRWAAGNLPVFVIASFGLALAVPVRDRGVRVALAAGTLLVCFVAMVAISAVEVVVVSASWADRRAGLLLLSESQRLFFVEAHGAIGVLQMLLPATLAVLAYAMLWAQEGEAHEDAPVSWRPAVGLVLALLTVVGVSALPAPTPTSAEVVARLSRTAERNPASAEVRLALAAAEGRALIARGQPCEARERVDRALHREGPVGGAGGVDRVRRRADRLCRRAARG